MKTAKSGFLAAEPTRAQVAARVAGPPAIHFGPVDHARQPQSPVSPSGLTNK
jgi:hypothetical protein